MSLSNPTISVLMPVYNTEEEYLREAIESILNQTFTDFEFIIYNDGSTNNAKEVILSYKDTRIKYFEHENSGIAKTTNKMLDLANGKYVALMDSDDISLPNRLQLQYDFLEKNIDVSIVSAGYNIIGSDLVYTPKIDVTFVDLLKENCVANPVVMYRLSDIRKHHLRLNEVFDCAQDYEFYSRAIRFLKIKNIQEPLLEYRVLSNSNSHSNIKRIQSKDKEITDKMLDFLTDDKNLQQKIVKLIAKQNKKKTSLFEWIFSIKNSSHNKKKIIRLFGIKVSFRKKERLH